MAYRLFRHTPTSRWIKLIQDPLQVTPGEAYLPELAQRYALDPAELEVVVVADLPTDFESASVPVPVVPPTEKEVEQAEAEVLRLPTFEEIDDLVDTIFPALTVPQRGFLKRLAKLTRALYP